MNLFDYIKYQYTDISSQEELERVPPYVIQKYYLKALMYLYGETEERKLPNETFSELCRDLASWNEEQIYKETKECSSKMFLEVLKEYCDEPV